MLICDDVPLRIYEQWKTHVRVSLKLYARFSNIITNTKLNWKSRVKKLIIYLKLRSGKGGIVWVIRECNLEETIRGTDEGRKEDARVRLHQKPHIFFTYTHIRVVKYKPYFSPVMINSLLFLIIIGFFSSYTRHYYIYNLIWFMNETQCYIPS